MLGMNATYADNLTVDQLVSVNNNTEHFNTSPVSGGVKIARSRGVVVRNSVLNDNYGPGLWIDESVYDMTVTGNEMRNNAKHGLSLEISAKATVSNNTISGNDGFGIKVNDTSNVTISNNTFVGNDRSINIVQDSADTCHGPGPRPAPAVPGPDDDVEERSGHRDEQRHVEPAVRELPALRRGLHARTAAPSRWA